MEDPGPFQQGRKRTLEQFQESPYYKLRGVLKDLRPHFIQEITAESSPLEKCSTVPNDSSGDTRDEPKPTELQENAKSAENIPLDGGSPTIISDHQAQGTYTVGGSAFGLNFVTFIGDKSMYYGRTRESFRAANPKLDINE